jgi:GNAT superfamily N-acetyltransferase
MLQAMIIKCTNIDVESICSIINDAAIAYKGIIPDDRWHEPYMTLAELESEIEKGVDFWGYKSDHGLIGVMGIQNVQEVTLIRHAYVKSSERGKGIGTQLLHHLIAMTEKPILIGTWKAAVWAVRFYEKQGFEMVSEIEKNKLLKTYWTIPERQIETSVVLADSTWEQPGGQPRIKI